MARNKKRKGRASQPTAPVQSAQNGTGPTVVDTVARVPRNPFALNPLMRKSGSHQKSKSADRAKANRETQRQAREW